MLLERVHDLEDVLPDDGPHEVHIKAAEDDSIYIIVERDNKVVYAEAGLDDDEANTAAAFLTVLIGGGLL